MFKRRCNINQYHEYAKKTVKKNWICQGEGDNQKPQSEWYKIQWRKVKKTKNEKHIGRHTTARKLQLKQRSCAPEDKAVPVPLMSSVFAWYDS
jgi:hypothetical protein